MGPRLGAQASPTLTPALSRGERESTGESTRELALLDGGAEAYPRMLEAIDSATRRVHLEVYAFERAGVGSRFISALTAAAHRGVDFLPDRGFVLALKRAAKRGVEVHLLLAGRSDVPFARAATQRLYRTQLKAGVRIHEWTATTLHAKAAVVDDQRLLVGSFNLDPLSLVNLETLVEVEDADVAAEATRWMERHMGLSTPVGLEDCERSGVRGWLLEVVGLAVARFAERFASFVGSRRMRRRD